MSDGDEGSSFVLIRGLIDDRLRLWRRQRRSRISMPGMVTTRTFDLPASRADQLVTYAVFGGTIGTAD
jgi:hypothetical protein